MQPFNMGSVTNESGRMRKDLSDEELAARFKVVVDYDAEPVDWDAVIARFLIRCVRRQRQQSDANSPHSDPPPASLADKQRDV